MGVGYRRNSKFIYGALSWLVTRFFVRVGHFTSLTLKQGLLRMFLGKRAPICMFLQAILLTLPLMVVEFHR